MRVPISAVIPTYNRPEILCCTLQSLSKQDVQPSEIIIIDASETPFDIGTIKNYELEGDINWHKAVAKGAAIQRNQGVNEANYDFILFLDDDILFEPNCIGKLWQIMNTNSLIGGVNAMITNQKYTKPGIITQSMYFLMHGERLKSYAGKCIGPAWNLLPEEKDDLTEAVRVDWLNTTCTLYRKSVLPNPTFSSHFTGYSLMEDLELSLIVGERYELCNIANARIFHDSQPGFHKSNVIELSKMELVNRHYIMTKVLKRKGLLDFIKLFVFEVFGLLSSLRAIKKWKILTKQIHGKILAVIEIINNSLKK